MTTKLRIERLMRLYTLRTWAFGLAVASGVTAFYASGVQPLSYIATWSSSFIVMASAGIFQNSVIPLVILTIIFLAVGLILHLVIKSIENVK